MAATEPVAPAPGAITLQCLLGLLTRRPSRVAQLPKEHYVGGKDVHRDANCAPNPILAG